MSYQVITPPTAYPVTLGELKNHCRIETNDDDVYLQSLIEVATSNLESFAWRSFMTQTIELTLDGFDRHELILPRGKVQSVTSIYYIDTAGDSTLLPSNEYLVDTKSDIGRITPAYGYSWPTTQCRINTVTITYVSGFGSSQTDVPEPLRHAVMLLAADLYQNREGHTELKLDALPFGIKSLVQPYRVNHS